MHGRAVLAAAVATGMAVSTLVGVGTAEAAVTQRAPAALTIGPRTLDVPLNWSKTAARPVSRAITYRNTTRSAVRVRLKVALRDRTGKAAPAGLARLSATSLSVPAGREAKVDLALRRHGVKPGRYRGTVLATSAGRTVGTTSVSVDLRAPVPRPAPPVGNVTASSHSVIADLASPGIPDLTRRLQLVYRNPGARPVTLRLAADMNGPGGESTKAPAALLSLPAQVTVPARGSKPVTLTFRGAKIPHGRYIGALFARSADGRTKVTTTLVADVGRENYNVALDLTDRNGAPAKPTWVYAWSVSDGGRWSRKIENGTGVLELPPGTYDLSTAIATGEGETLINHRVTIDDWDLRLAMDARQGKPVELSPQGVDIPGQLDVWLETPWYRMTAEGPAGSVFAVWHGPAPSDERVGFQVTSWGARDATNGPGGAYLLSRSHSTGIPASTVWHPAPSELSVIRNHFRAANVAGTGSLDMAGGFVDGFTMKVAFPQTVTTYVQPGLLFSRELWYGIEYENGATIAEFRQLAERGTRDEVWNGSVLSPEAFGSSTHRYSDDVSVQVSSQYRDSFGHEGQVDRLKDELTLADGEQTLASGTRSLDARLPAERRRYTLNWVRTGNTDISLFSTKTVTEWSFESEHSDDTVPLPLHLPRLAVPGLDGGNAAAPGSELRIPVKLAPPDGLAAPTITSVSIEVSADGGQTWQAGAAGQEGGEWFATVTNPGSPGFVDLRIKVTDAAGTTVTQTVTRAYEVRS